MAEPTTDRGGITGAPVETMTFRMRPPGTVAEALDQRRDLEAETAWQAAAQSAGAQEPEAEKPSAIVEGAKAGAEAFVEGGKMVAEGILRTATGRTQTGGAPGPADDPSVKMMLDGLMSMGLAPFVALGAGGRQALKNQAPEIEAQPVLDPQLSGFIRTMMGGAVPKVPDEQYAQMPPAEQQAYRDRKKAAEAPMTVGEILELGVQFGGPALGPKAIRAAKDVAPKVGEALKSERGALGRPPTPEEMARDVGEQSRHKDVVAMVNRRYSERIEKNRGRQTHEQTIAESRETFPSFEDATRATVDELVVSKAKLLRFGDYYRVLEREVMDLEAKARAGDTKAAAMLDDALPLLIDMAEKQVLAGSQLGRGLEALKIMSDADRVDPKTARLVTQQIGETVQAETTRLGALQQELTGLTNKALGTREVDLVRAERSAATLEARIAEAKADQKDAATLQRHVESARKEVADLKAALKQAEPAKTGKLERDLDKATAAAEKLEQQLAEAKADQKRLDVWQRHLADEQARVKDLRGQITERRKNTPNLERLEAAVLRQQELVETLTRDLADANEAWRYAQGMLDERGYGIKTVAELKARLKQEGITGLDLARALRELPQRERNGFLATLGRYYKATNDVFHWLFLQSVLSGPVTHAANLLGTGAAVAWHYPERYTAEWINRIFFKDPAGVQRGETYAMARATGQGLSDGVRLLGKTLAKGAADPAATKVEARFDVSSRYFGLDAATPLGRLVDTIGMFFPTRWLQAEDGLFKGFIRRTEIAGLAVAEGMKSGLRGKELESFVAFTESHPTPEMLKAAGEAALTRTLNAELGPVGRAAMTIRDWVPLGSYLFPFIRTPGNSFKWSYQRTPVLSQLSYENWRAVERGGRERDMALARMALGSAVSGAVAYHVLQGNITGGLPAGSNKNLKRDLKAEGAAPYSIRSGDGFYVYKRTDPVGQYLGTIATAIEIYSQWGINTPEAPWDYADFAIVAGVAASRVALDAPWMMGLSNVFDAIEKPDVNGKKIAQGLARGIVPNVLRQATTSGLGPEALGLPADTFPNLVDPRPEIREMETILDVLKAGLFTFADDVAPITHPITGDAIVRPPGWGPDILSPIFVTMRKHDPVMNEILEHGMNFAEPSRVLAGAGDPTRKGLDATQIPDAVKLTAWQYFRLKELATKEARDGQGRTLHEAMTAMIESREYQVASGGPDGGKELRLQLIYRNFYERAKGLFLRESGEAKQRVMDQRRQRLERLRPDDLTPTLGR